MAFGVATVVKFGKEALNVASDLTEVQNVVEVAFGNMQGKVEEFAASAIENFGMSELQAKRTASTYMAMSKGMGLAGESAADMSINATKRAGDIASFYNASLVEVDTMLKSIWTGETESLKRIGVVMTQTNLQQFALTQGIKKNISEMNQAELTQLRYAYVMQQTNLAAGDFIRTQDSWANQTRILQEQFRSFLGVLGKGLIQVLTPAVKILNQLLKSLIKLAQAFQAVTGNLFGTQDTSSQNSFTDSVNDTVQAEQDLEKSANKAKKALLGFDEINTLDFGETNSSGTVEPTIPDSIVADNPIDLEADVTLNPKIQNAAETIKRILEPTKKALESLWEALDPVKDFVWTGLKDFYESFLKPMATWTFGEALPRFFGAIENAVKLIDWDNLNQSLKNFWEKLEPFAEAVGEGVLWFWENVLVPLGTWVINDAVPTFLDLLSGALDVLTPIIDGARDGFGWLWDNFLKPLAEYVADKAIQTLKDFAEKLSTIGDWLSEHKWAAELIGTFAAVIGAVAAAIGIFNGVCAIAAPIIGAFSAAMAAINWPIVLITAAIAALIAIVVVLVKHWDEIKEVAKKCWDKIVETWHAAGDWFKKNVVEPIKNFFTGLWGGIKETAKQCWDKIVEAWNTAGTWFSENIIEPIKNFFSGLWDSVKLAAQYCWELISGIWKNVSNWFYSNVIAPVSNFFTGMWDGIKNAFSTAWDFISRAFKGYVNNWIYLIESFINFFIAGINVLVKGLNKVSFNVPDWVPGIGGKNLGFNIPLVPKVQIPRLATGAVIPPNAEFAAILGDQKHGRNLEAPEKLIRQIVRDESKNAGGNWTIQVIDNTGQIKFETVITEVERRNRRDGKTIIPLGV